MEFLLRIFLPEVETKFALKVLPSLKGSDVILMVHNQIQNRKLSVDLKAGKYGLFIPSQKVWMDENQTLDKFECLHTVSLGGYTNQNTEKMVGLGVDD